MRVCADPDDPPASMRDATGFNDQIAAIVADELGATLSFVWTPGGAYAVKRALQPGDCDVIFGAPESSAGMLNSVPYLQTPFAFVARADAPPGVTSLDDPALRALHVAVAPNAVAHKALLDAGLADSIVLVAPDWSAPGALRDVPLVDAVLQRRADLAILSGESAAYLVKQHPGALALAPISPAITSSGLPLFEISTVGVRPGDDALRDRLDIALAVRWSDIQAVLADHGIPTIALPAPLAPTAVAPGTLRIGVLLPIPSGLAAPTDTAGAQALAGAALAERLLGEDASSSGRRLRLYRASAPTPDAARRAAARLLATDHVAAILGGLGAGQADAIGSVAEERGSLFFNVGDASTDLRAECRATTFHVAASTGMQLDALASALGARGATRWFVVDGAAGGTERVAQALASAPVAGEVIGTVPVDPDQSVFYDVVDTITAAAPDVVLLLLPPSTQEQFLAQLPSRGGGPTVVGLLPVEDQTRAFVTRLRQDDPAGHAALQLVQWDPSLDVEAAAALADEFAARTGEPMGTPAWTTYAAVGAAVSAAAATGSTQPDELRRYLEDAHTMLDLGKGVGLSFRPWDHQLRQPLYLIEIDPSARWGPQPGKRTALADVAATVPAAIPGSSGTIRALDTLGDGSDALTCW